jgi:predicted dehydrogenase
VEKPVALTAQEGEKMIEKSKETGCQVQVGQVIRFWDEYVELRKFIESGVYGKVVNANFRRLSPRPDWGWNNWLLDCGLSGGAAQDLHVHDIDYALSVFGQPKKFYSMKNLSGETNSYINTLLQYDDFVVSVEGTWDLPASYPFTATFRAVFENAVVENAGGKFMLYTKDGMSEIKIEKKELVGGVDGGNISDLGGYYNELLYFCNKAKTGERIEQAKLCDGVSSLEFLLRELAFNA